MNQDCSERMITKAAEVVLGTTIEFNYPTSVADIQLDLSEAFHELDESQKTLLFSGNDKLLLEKDLVRLDKHKAYFLRTGRGNNAPGHYQLLYFKDQHGWHIYSSETNQYQLTDSTGNLTETGCNNILVRHAKWGLDGYSLFLVEAIQLSIVRAANYIYDFRLSGPEVALARCYIKFPELPEFYNALRQTRNQSPTPKKPDNTEPPLPTLSSNCMNTVSPLTTQSPSPAKPDNTVPLSSTQTPDCMIAVSPSTFQSPSPVKPGSIASPSPTLPSVAIETVSPSTIQSPSAVAPDNAIPPSPTLTPEQIKRINDYITCLQREIDSFWPYPHKDRKKEKINAWEMFMQQTNQGMAVMNAVEHFKRNSRSNNTLAGRLSTRSHDLLTQIENECGQSQRLRR